MNKKAYRLVGLAFLVLTLVALPGVASSAMWVGVEIGGNFAASPDIDVTGGGTTTFNRVKIDPSVIGGVTIGYDFVKEGFGGYNWPDWMKYFSFATDFTYNRLDMRKQNLSASVDGVSVVGGATFPQTEGYMAAWTFLFMAHYGFLPDSEVPAGRLHPYIGVGPCVLFSGLNIGDIGVGVGNQIGSRSSINVALVTEAGLRFMALKNVSLDAAFRYRWASPTYGFEDSLGVTHDISLDAHQFSFLFRTSYHF